MREALTAAVLDGPYDRTATDLREFYGSGRFREFERLACGDYTATDLIGHHKYVSAPYYPVTDFELARQYLKHIWREQAPKGKKRVGFNHDTWNLLQLNPPAYFRRKVCGELAYVDIKSCYFQLYSPLTLDLDYGPDGTFALGKVRFLDPDWLVTEKRIRNGVVGIARAHQREEYRHGEFWQGPSFNKFLAPELWGYLMHTLHAIAAECIRQFPVYYWNTDGLITEDRNRLDVINYLHEAWSLTATVRGRGPGEVYGFGSFAIGDARSKVVHGSGEHHYVLRYDPLHAARLKRWRKWSLKLADSQV